MITPIHGNAMDELASHAPESFDAIVTDPPYGETSLKWDRWPRGWLKLCLRLLKPSGSLWCFGSMRMFLAERAEFDGWRFVQDLVWEKQNGTSSANDRFRRVHELACQFIPEGAKWADVYKAPVTTPDAVKRQVRRKKRPAHWGDIGEHSFKSEDGGPRLMRSVVFMRNMHGRAIHPTQKPEGIIEPLLRYSVPPGGLVLDPFMGSGTTLAVARELGMGAVGIEANETYYRAARDRLAGTLALGGAA
jgi:site-specific DNA-methyltransferase (adenine-specific)